MICNSGYMTVNLDKVFILFLLNVPSTHFLSVLTEAARASSQQGLCVYFWLMLTSRPLQSWSREHTCHNLLKCKPYQRSDPSSSVEFLNTERKHMQATSKYCYLFLCLTRKMIQCRLLQCKTKTYGQTPTSWGTLVGLINNIDVDTAYAFVTIPYRMEPPASATQQYKPRIRVTLRRKYFILLTWINWKHKKHLTAFK